MFKEPGIRGLMKTRPFR